jgi:hypothetical protein
MKIVELVIDSDSDGIEAISLVDRPAIESNFIALSKEVEIKFSEVDQKRGILMGPALIPDKNIYRKYGKDEFYVFFSKETVRKASELYLMNGNQSNATLQHNKKIDGINLVESWIIEDEKLDKSVKFGFNEPVGTWMVSLKVDNQDIKDRILSGEVKGFSIEGYFTDKVEMSNDIDEDQLVEEILKVLEDGEE